jgi:hypothetical protein
LTLTAAKVRTAFDAIKTAVPGALITISYKARDNQTYSAQGIRAPVMIDEESIPGRGKLQNVEGAVRVNVANLPGSDLEGTVNAGRLHPRDGDEITVNNVVRVVMTPQYDELRATVRINYGSRYA